MTKDSLHGKHYAYYSDADKHTVISVEYAISILEELAGGYQIMTEDGVNGIPTGSVTGKIKELKALLK